LSDELSESGGRLLVGVYNLGSDVTAGAANAEAIRLFHEGVATKPLVRELVPFDQSVYDWIDSLDDSLDARGIEPVFEVADSEERRAKLHAKVNVFLSAETVEKGVPQPWWLDIVEEYALARLDQVTAADKDDADIRELHLRVSERAGAKVESWTKTLSDAEKERMVAYFLIGSHNQNYRSTITDGEVSYLVAETKAMMAYVDLVLMIALVTWVDSAEELETMIPNKGFDETGVGWFLRKQL
jgi:hypothetical protein